MELFSEVSLMPEPRIALQPLRKPLRASRLLASLVLGCLAFSASARSTHRSTHHPPKKMEREQVEELERQWSQAMLSSDIPALDKLLSNDYLGVTAAGDLLTKAQQLDRIRTRQLLLIKLNTIETKIKLVGQIAIVTSLAQIDSMNEGRPMVGSFRYTKVYQRLPSGVWQITSFEATPVRRGDRIESRAAGTTPQP